MNKREEDKAANNTSRPLESNAEFLEEYFSVLEKLCWLRGERLEEHRSKSSYSEVLMAEKLEGTEPETPPDPAAVKAFHHESVRLRKRVDATLDQRPEVDLPLVRLSRQLGLDDLEETVLMLVIAYRSRRGFESLMDAATSCGDCSVRALLKLAALAGWDAVRARSVFTPSSRLAACGLITVGSRTSWRSFSESDFLRVVPEVPLVISNMVMGYGRVQISTDKTCTVFDAPVDPASLDLPPELVQELESVAAHEKQRIEMLEASEPGEYSEPGIILMWGPAGSGALDAARALAGMLGRNLCSIRTLPYLRQEYDEPEDLARTLGLVRLQNAVPCFVSAERLMDDDPDDFLATGFAEELAGFGGTVILLADSLPGLGGPLGRLVGHVLQIPVPGPERRAEIIRQAIPDGVELAPDFDAARVAGRLELCEKALKGLVRSACRRVSLRREDRVLHNGDLLPGEGSEGRHGRRFRRDMSEDSPSFVTRPKARLESVVLSEALKLQVSQIIKAVKARETVFEKWGMGEVYGTGRGISALFSGPSGTGKTLTAEAIAGELDRSMRVVRIAGIMDKYVGETEKHIAEVFRLSAASGDVLVFDEADALFAARVDAAEHGSYYINSHINTLLKEMEDYTGIVILTTNLALRLDPAFERRIRWKLVFPVPDAKARASLWRKLLPPSVPLAGDVDLDALAGELEFTGGLIRSAVLKAAYEAAADGVPVSMRHLREAARVEKIAADGEAPKSGIGFGVTA